MAPSLKNPMEVEMARTPSNTPNIDDGEIKESFGHIDELLKSQIMERGPASVAMAGLTLVLILLNDLLQKAAQDGMRIAFSDDVDPAWGRDITDLVNKMQNAVCHVSSGDRRVGEIRYSFNVLSPGAGIVHDGKRIACDYPDDVAFNYGGKRIYLFRHIQRAAQEAADTLMPGVEARRDARMRAIRARARGFPID